MNRETWLNEMAVRMAPRFAELGHALPPYRVSMGLPSSGMRAPVAGECWSKTVSADEHYEIFINPVRDDSVAIGATLAHELAHAAVGLQCGHKGDFAKVVSALGFGRPYTSTEAGTTPVVRAWLQGMINDLGRIPHARLSTPRDEATPVRRGVGGVELKSAAVATAPRGADEPESNRPPKQTTRLMKAECAECGYTVRVTSKWLEVGPPHCPVHGAMAVEQKGSANE